MRKVQPYKYNGKEFIEDFGLDEYDSQFRYYYSAIGRTPTMDAHAENYYHISPYAWCGNNFVNAFDPDGRDWFQNNETGEVQYNSELRASDIGSAPQLTGDGWSWLGDNNLFGTVDEKFLSDNKSSFSNERGDISGYYPIGEADGTTRRGYQIWLSPESSQNFMDAQGYKSVPTQAIEYELSIPIRESMGGGAGRFSSDAGCRTQITEKTGYVPNNYSLRHVK